MSDVQSPRPDLTRVDLNLRTRQVDYLEYLAERDDVPISTAFASLVESRIGELPTEIVRPPRKRRLHIIIQRPHIAFIDALAARLGVWRADIVRRLIDEAMLKDKTI